MLGNRGEEMAREFSKKIYESRRWRKCAKAFAESKLYVCERCHNAIPHKDGRTQRFIVHHIQPLTPDNVADDSIVYGWDNLMLLCQECHNAIHGRHDDGRRIVFDDDGNVVGVVDADRED